MSEAGGILIWPQVRRARIAPELHGLVIEHVGRSIYEGVWVGENARIPHEGGVRFDVLAALKHLRTPMLRWPGDAFAAEYHWRAGIGPYEGRALGANAAGRQGESNGFGTAEYAALCQALCCAPHISVNLATGSPRTSRNWLEYCCFGGDSQLSRMRGAHGDPRPYEVGYWRLGDPDALAAGVSGGAYAESFRAHALAMKRLDPRVALVAYLGAVEGLEKSEGRTFLHDFAGALCAGAFPEYLAFSFQPRLALSEAMDAEAFAGCFSSIALLERGLACADAFLDYAIPEKPIGIALDPWGIWRAEATPENGREQPHALVDALWAAATLHVLHRFAHRVRLASLAHAVNALHCLLCTHNGETWLTPTYYVYEMMQGHCDAERLYYEADPDLPLSVSVSCKGRQVLVSVVNPCLDLDVPVCIRLRELAGGSVSGRVLNAAMPARALTATDRIRPKRIKITAESGTIHHVFPAHSFTTLSIKLD